MNEYASALAASVEVEAAGANFPALDLPALIASKRATRRRKDQDQIPELEALLELRNRR